MVQENAATPLLRVEVVKTAARSRDVSAVHEARHIPDADQTAPGFFAHQRTDFFEPEHIGQHIAAGTRHFVDEHHFGAINARVLRQEWVNE